mgnify:CR=1 FL=1
MIKNLLLTIALVLSIAVQAQIPNMSFETWTTTPFGLQPVGWLGITVNQQTTGAQQGTSYVRIITTSTSSPAYDGVFYATSNITPTMATSGVPYTQRPVSLNGFYKTSGLGVGDTVQVYSLLLETGNLVAIGTTFYETNNVPVWTSFSVPYSYFSVLNPDTVHIIASSNEQCFGGGPNAIGSTLDLDNLSFMLTTRVDVMSVGTAFMVYPNPASSELNVVSKDETATTISIIDVTGRTIDEISIENEKTRIDLEKYASGIYSYSILNSDRSILLKSKFTVSK